MYLWLIIFLFVILIDKVIEHFEKKHNNFCCFVAFAFPFTQYGFTGGYTQHSLNTSIPFIYYFFVYFNTTQVKLIKIVINNRKTSTPIKCLEYLYTFVGDLNCCFFVSWSNIPRSDCSEALYSVF